MTTLKELREQWMEDRAFRAKYDALDEEFALAAALIDARAQDHLTQEQVASRMETTQAYVAKMEGLKVNRTGRDGLPRPLSGHALPADTRSSRETIWRM